MIDLKDSLLAYVPYNEIEQADKKIILDCLERYDDIFERTNLLVHMTASAWVTNKQKTKILMAYHNIYKSFAWLGGHCDGEKDCLALAIKEVKEESGLTDVSPLSEDIFSIEVLTVNGHYKKGKYVPSHLHLNVTYLLTADDTQHLRFKEDENSAVQWFDIDLAVQASNEEWFKENVYSKLNRKLKEKYL